MGPAHSIPVGSGVVTMVRRRLVEIAERPFSAVIQPPSLAHADAKISPRPGGGAHG